MSGVNGSALDVCDMLDDVVSLCPSTLAAWKRLRDGDVAHGEVGLSASPVRCLAWVKRWAIMPLTDYLSRCRQRVATWTRVFEPALYRVVDAISIGLFRQQSGILGQRLWTLRTTRRCRASAEGRELRRATIVRDGSAYVFSR